MGLPLAATVTLLGRRVGRSKRNPPMGYLEGACQYALSRSSFLSILRRSILAGSNSTETIMADDRIKILEERLMRLEAAMAQQPTARQGFTSPGTVVDPPPNPGGWGFPRPRPVVDPAPWPWWGYHHWPPYIVDPPPWPPTTISDPAPWPNPIVDPASIDRVRATATANFARIGPSVDPLPIDVSRLTASQLESSLHTINAERSRLDSMETMIKQRLENLKQQKEG